MYRHSPVRNPRSKGIKIRHVLQVCLLVAVCFWLIFQVKRSHDKKKEFETKIPSSIRTQNTNEIVKFGRKELRPKLEETTKEVDIHEQEEPEEKELEEDNKNEEEEQDHEEENKNEEEEQEDDKIEEEKDDGGGGGGGDDEIDENEQEKADVEIEQEEMETIDEDKETDSGEEKEREEEKDEKTETETENEGSLDNHDEDGATAHTNEAREEHYKADDASSAVTHDVRTLGSESENGNKTLENSRENGATENGNSANRTMIQETASESMVTSLNATTSKDSHENGPPSSTTMPTFDSTQSQNIIAPNATQESSNSEILEKGMDPLKTEVELETDAGEGESITDETDSDAIQHDTIDSSDPLHLEEKEVRTDLDTLPEIETEGSNSEDTAAE